MYHAHDWDAKSQDRMETAGFREYLMSKAFLRDTSEIVCFAELLFLIHIICTHTIYTLITHKCRGGYLERKIVREVSTTHPPIRESYPFLERNLCQSFLIPSPIVIPIEWRFLPKHYPHTLKVLKVVLVLPGSIGRCQGWRIQHGACCGIWRAR